MRRSLRKRHGFTLIEVMVSMSIFAAIATGTGSAVSRGTAIKKRVEQQWQEIHSIRTATTIFQRDISLAFNVRKAQKPGMTFITPQDTTPWFKTYFIGKEDELDFTSLANRKLYSGTHESDLCEIGYRLTPDENNSEQNHIFRRKSAVVDDQKDRGGEPIAILENTKALKFRYFSIKSDRWLDDWNSTEGDFKGKFPDAVEVTFTLPPRKKDEGDGQEYKTTVVLANPNNETPKDTGKKVAPKIPVNAPKKKEEGRDAPNA